MRIFFDTEFTGLRKDTTLISIGLVAESGDKFYAEFTDYDETKCDDWIRHNVLGNLFLYHVKETPDEKTLYMIDTKDGIACELNNWLQKFYSIEFVSDVCHYDMVLLIDLLSYGGTAFDLPAKIPAVCHDLNQDIDLPAKIPAVCHDLNQDIARHYGISDEKAFDMSREDLVKDLCDKEIEGRKHNALYDAEVIKAIFDEIGTK